MARPFGLGPTTLNLAFKIVGSQHVVLRLSCPRPLRQKNLSCFCVQASCPKPLGARIVKSPMFQAPQAFTSQTICLSLNVLSLYKHNILGLKKMHVLCHKTRKSQGLKTSCLRTLSPWVSEPISLGPSPISLFKKLNIL